jgi:hypothetical protein
MPDMPSRSLFSSLSPVAVAQCRAFCPRAYPPCPSLWLLVLLLSFPVGVFLPPVFPDIE